MQLKFIFEPKKGAHLVVALTTESILQVYSLDK